MKSRLIQCPDKAQDRPIADHEDLRLVEGAGCPVSGEGIPPMRTALIHLPIVVLAAAMLCVAGCKAFNINVGTEEPIKLDPIKIDLTMRAEVYMYEGDSEEAQKAAANRNEAAQRLRDRGAEIQELKNSRLVGENHLGLLSIRNRPAGEYGDYVVSTVDSENADRVFLMTDIANTSQKALSDVQKDQWHKKVAASFVGEWVEVGAEVDGTYRWDEKDS
jgi:hypothetical protein